MATAPKHSEPVIPPVLNDKVIPEGATCQEASILSKATYIPCGQPATAIIRHDKDRRSYYMCAACADHNVRNRGGKLMAEKKGKVTQMPAHGSLKQQMREQTAKSAPSMDPTTTLPPPPEKEEEIVPDIKELVQSPADRLKIKRLVASMIEWGAKKSEATKALKPISLGLKKLVGTYAIGKAVCDGATINYYNAPRTTIKGDLLMGYLLSKVGETVTTKMVDEALDAATVVTPTYTLRVTAPGIGEEEEG